ncbi:MAG: arginine--tRNA ligase, partial [Flavobacteriaceae bacterium]|nr:arginine--tRNA ligase [Flavobacteriaceae bacterium]
MSLQDHLKNSVKKAVKAIYDVELESVEFQATRREFDGDITVMVFPMLKHIKGNPALIGEAIGKFVLDNENSVSDFNVIKGFLNLVISDRAYIDFFYEIRDIKQFGFSETQGQDAIMVEYSSPNTNKPLHLGHIRNILLGYSVSEILKVSGKRVYKTQIINDRGIHICKSMLAWQRFGNGETPGTSGLKGDKLVGNYYIQYDKVYKAQVAELIHSGTEEDEAKKNAPILLEAQNMLRKWESGDSETVNLWKTMNQWVY